MANIRKNNTIVSGKNTQFSDPPLDTLAQLGHFEKNNGSNTLKKRAIAKYYTNEIIFPLIDHTKEKNPRWNKKFWNTFHCVLNLEKSPEGKVTGKYCKNRWCVVCNRIRTAVNINNYKPILHGYSDLYFVTLTAPTIPQEKLIERIDEMGRIFVDVKKVLRRNYNVRGIRKLEVTWNFRNNHYHPHYHLIIQGKEQAERLVFEWLKRNKTATRKAQDIRKADNNSLVEVFKYASKMFSDDKTQPSGIRIYPPEVMLTIFKSLHRKRIIQTFGDMKLMDDDFEPEIATVILDDNKDNGFEIFSWEQEYRMWINFDTGETII
jgi:hypothetical protein